MENLNDHENKEELEELFKILSNPNRLKIIHILAEKDNKEVTVNEISDKIKITQPATSQHLKILKKSKIVQCNKKGNNIYYKINVDTISHRKECVDSLLHKLLNTHLGVDTDD